MSEKFKCPGCGKEFEQLYSVPSSDLEPFESVDVMKGLEAYGSIYNPKALICHVEDYVHFAFVNEVSPQPPDVPEGKIAMETGEERLVKIEKFDQQALADRHQHHAEHPQRCDEEGCTALGIPCYYNWTDADPDCWYCEAHCYENGFCKGCGLFRAGTEDFDFSKLEMCGQCSEALEAEIEGDYADDEFDFDDDYPG